MQMTYFLNGPIFNLLFYCYIILHREKVTLCEKFNHNLTIDFQIVLVIQMEVLKCWKMVEFSKISIKWKCVKHFTRIKQQAALRKLFSLFPIPPPNQIKSYYVLWNKNFLMDIYSNIQKICKLCKISKWESFWLCCENMLFSMSSGLRFCKLSEVFWVKLYCKMSHLFC